jgi:hypothetical protein
MKGTALMFRTGLLAVGVVAVTSVAWGCDKEKSASACAKSDKAVNVSTATPTAAPAAAATPGAAEAGMRAFIDPETGTIGVPSPLPALTPEESKYIESQIQQEPVETIYPDGSAKVELNGHGQEYFIMQLDANGKPVARCVEDPKAALEKTPTAQPKDR